MLRVNSGLKRSLSTAINSVNVQTTKRPILFSVNSLKEPLEGKSLKFYIETYGCQMNLSDSEIVRSILMDAGHQSCSELGEADLILTNTCAIRENAEAKVWNRLKFFQSIRNKNRVKGTRTYFPIVGVLGCMAERLKEKLLLEDSVDFVCGPDAYRDVPSLLQSIVSVGQKQANTVLSFDETYADISPVREVDRASAFVSIMRGCNNMCSFCIVPFTRGRERSRPMTSILTEIQTLNKKGVKEIVLLGQNVNGYHDTSAESAAIYPISTYQASPGFTNLYQSRKRDLAGARFADLLHSIADIDINMRIRFTSPHPKDFPLEALQAIAQRPNICASIHLPAQSGSSSVLERMRRGYTREAYLTLVKQIRDLIPHVSISTDLIAGFCDETDEEHQETLSLIREVRFDQAFMYAYSLRDRTHAAHTMSDNISETVKQRRLQEIIDTYREVLLQKNITEEHGALRLVLVEGLSSKSDPLMPMYTGRTEGNKRVVFPATALIPALTLVDSIHSNRTNSSSNKSIGSDSYDDKAVQSTTDIRTISDRVAMAVLGSSFSSSSSSIETAIDSDMKTKLLTRGLLYDYTISNNNEINSNNNDSSSENNNASVDTVYSNKTTSSASSSKEELLWSGVPEFTPMEDIIGQYVAVRVLKADTPTMRGVALGLSSIKDFPILVDKVMIAKN